MKKLNNKGFAISTLIYGLAIMGIMIVAILMATMAQTRSNNSALAKSIEDDLNRFSKTETSFRPQVSGDLPTAQEYIIPDTGWYKIELWGSQGAGNGGRGAYTSGVIRLDEGDRLYFYVGKHLLSGTRGVETDVRIESGSYEAKTSYETRIMVAAGGGTSSEAAGGTLSGYSNGMASFGGFIKSQGNDKDFSLIPETDPDNDTNATLVGYVKDYSMSTTAQPSSAISISGQNGGGDGFFPSNSSTTGGASYIAGYAGSNGILKETYTPNPRFVYYEPIYNTETDDGTYTYETDPQGIYYFIDGIMIPGVKTGDGYAKIERIKSQANETVTFQRKNQKLNNVKIIEDCVDDNTHDSSFNIYAIYNGELKAGTLQTPSGNCRSLVLNENTPLDEIGIQHTSNKGVDYKNHTIRVSDGSTWSSLKAKAQATDYSETETAKGIKISAYQYDSTGSIPSAGNYIIQPVLSESKVLTAPETSASNADPIKIDYYKGEKYQKWSIELITDTKISPGYVEGNPSTYEYKIIELARRKALAISQGENLVYNTLSATDKFNDKARNESQIWKIVPLGNNTYIIATVVDQQKDTGFILPQTNHKVSDKQNQIIIGKNNADTARFKLIQIDYSSN